MNRAVEWIDDDGALAAVVAAIGGGPVALDTEADSYHRYRGRICLIQLSFGRREVLIDPLAGVDLGVLAPALEAPDVRKVVHGADYDLRMLDRDFGLSVRGLFDTMVAARLAGERAFGLASLAQSHLGAELDKGHQLADWSVRPLPDAMIAYAAEDTRHLIALADLLEERLRRLGRLEWAREEFQHLETVRWSEPEAPREAFRRIRGSTTLEPRSLAVLRELHAWRESAARDRDVPPFRVMRDDVLLRLARRPPRSEAALARVAGTRGRPGRTAEVMRVIEGALRLPRSSWPARRRGGGRPEAARYGKATKRLRERRDEIASRLGLEPSLLASRALLESIAERERAGEEWRSLPALRRWQVALLESVVADVGAGQG